jgi:hypothetical protein
LALSELLYFLPPWPTKEKQTGPKKTSGFVERSPKLAEVSKIAPGMALLQHVLV